MHIEIQESPPSLPVLGWDAEIWDWTDESSKYHVVEEAKPEGVHSDTRIHVTISVGEEELTPPRDISEPNYKRNYAQEYNPQPGCVADPSPNIFTGAAAGYIILSSERRVSLTTTL